MIAPEMARADVASQIEQLACRYALAIDSRDLETVVELFSENADFCRHGAGARGCTSFFRELGSTFGLSVHSVSNHIIECKSETSASGIVYCRAERCEFGGTWVTHQLAYYDEYVLERGSWRFRSREIRYFFIENGTQPRIMNVDSRRTLPESWGTWDTFWSARAAYPGSQNADGSAPLDGAPHRAEPGMSPSSDQAKV
ncbi:hypothetical protein RW1_022_01260 [Rhodococcus wratislaviensis NBRC 100605]|uniref:SnoaL-like domain-containing protein n=1 Tax=Rhodococcus wratislaviensis NBRC 100605 TaxID=1219028 RepID=X0Q4V8_RHOWR|nr:hypothetical protein RW1_022_01260 [Rhodococcus wratislaviensis NBRC 100605]